MKLKLFYCLFLVLNSIGFQLFGQINLGQPFIENYSKEDYLAGTQNWQITQDQFGVMYFANNNGLLSYNGKSWRLYKLPNHTICRSVYAIGNRIYVGGQGEFGYFEPNEKGQLIFESINLNAQESIGLEDFWNIVFFNGKVLFQNNTAIIEYDPNQTEAKKLPLKGVFIFMGEFLDNILIQTQDSGSFIYDGRNLNKLSSFESFQGNTITGIINNKDYCLISTLRNGLFKFKNDSLLKPSNILQPYFENKSIYKAISYSNQGLVFATSLGGLIFLDNDLQFKFLLNKSSGLQNNNVLSVFVDKGKNLWLGLDNGIDFILINSPLRRFYPDGFLEGTSYCAATYNEKLIVGTNNGLYYRTLASNLSRGLELANSFESYYNLSGQVWNLKEIDNLLFINHHEGLFVVEDSILEKVGSHVGSWEIQPCLANSKYYIEGTYKGVNLLKKNNEGAIEIVGKLKGFEESSRFISQQDDGKVWVAHPYKGVYRFELDIENCAVKNLEDFKQQNKLNVSTNFKVFDIDKMSYFTAENGIFYFNKNQNEIIQDSVLSSHFEKSKGFSYLKQTKPSEIWYITDKEECGRLKIQNNGLSREVSKVQFPKLKGKLVNGFEFINEVNESVILFGAEKGMICFYDSINPKIDTPLVYIDRLLSFGGIDSTFIDGLNTLSKTTQKFTLLSEQNNLLFEFFTPVFQQNNLVEYSYKLEGYDNFFSEWTSETKKEYTNLNPGKYKFQVRARILNSFISKTSEVELKILAPWYLSRYAYGFYSLLLISLVFGLIFFPQQKFNKEKDQLEKEQAKKLKEKEMEHNRIVQSRENEMIKLKNEKLENEINYKNQELATSTMNLVQKTEILNKINQELIKTESQLSNKEFVESQIKKVNKLITDNIKLDKNWDQFAYQFDKVHVDFNRRLKEQFPELTPNEKKLCAYLRLNLTTKEIASLMNISVRGVEISRYRLRKKLNLDRNQNLNDFISGL